MSKPFTKSDIVNVTVAVKRGEKIVERGTVIKVNAAANSALVKLDSGEKKEFKFEKLAHRRGRKPTGSATTTKPTNGRKPKADEVEKPKTRRTRKAPAEFNARHVNMTMMQAGGEGRGKAFAENPNDETLQEILDAVEEALRNLMENGAEEEKPRKTRKTTKPETKPVRKTTRKTVKSEDLEDEDEDEDDTDEAKPVRKSTKSKKPMRGGRQLG